MSPSENQLLRAFLEIVRHHEHDIYLEYHELSEETRALLRELRADVDWEGDQ